VPELTVSLPLWIISQIAIFLAVVLQVVAFQIKNKTTMLFFAGTWSALIAISTGLLLNWVVCGILAISAVRNWVFAYFEHRRTKGKEVHQNITLALFLLFSAFIIISVALTWVWWLDWVLLATVLTISYGGYAKGIHIFRLGYIAYYSFVIVNHLVFFNVVGIAQSVLLLGAMAVFYFRFFKNKMKPKDEAANASNNSK